MLDGFLANSTENGIFMVSYYPASLRHPSTPVMCGRREAGRQNVRLGAPEVELDPGGMPSARPGG